MTYSTQLTKEFRANGLDTLTRKCFAIVARRPVSHLAAATFLATSVYVAHEGLTAALPGSLAVALTALVIAISVLQWLAHGRYEACVAERDTDRADAVMQQAWMFGAIETVMFAVGGLALCARDGLDAWSPIGICFGFAGAAVFAFANFRVKWTSCDAVTVRKPRPSADSLFAQPEPPPAARAPLSDPDMSADDVGVISLMDRIAQREALHALDRKAMATATKTAAQRLERAAGRIRTRAYRAARKAAA